MQLRMMKAALLNGLQCVNSVVDKKNTIPVLSNILFTPNPSTGTVTLTGTNLETGITTHCLTQECEGEAVTIPAQKLLEIVKELPDTSILISTDDKSWVTVECQKARFKLAGLPSTDFPNVVAPTGQTVTLPQALIRQMLGHVLPFVSHDESRYALTGVLFAFRDGELRMVATDGHRLAFDKQPVDALTDDQQDAPADDANTEQPAAKREYIIHLKAASELKKLCSSDAEDVRITLAENQAAFSTGATTVTTRLIDAQFPDYEAVIPTTSKGVAVAQREEFAAALRRVALLCSDTKMVKCHFINDTLTFMAADPNTGDASESIGMEYQAEPFVIGFNARYIMDVLSVTGGNDLRIALSGELYPALFTTDSPADAGLQIVVMPMRI